MGKPTIKKTLVCLLLVVGLLAVARVEAQQPAELPKIGWIAVRPASAAFAIEAFQRE